MEAHELGEPLAADVALEVSRGRLHARRAEREEQRLLLEQGERRAWLVKGREMAALGAALGASSTRGSVLGAQTELSGGP